MRKPSKKLEGAETKTKKTPTQGDHGFPKGEGDPAKAQKERLLHVGCVAEELGHGSVELRQGAQGAEQPAVPHAPLEDVLRAFSKTFTNRLFPPAFFMVS